MKFYKYSLIAALALSGALSACDDDLEYTPGPEGTGEQFYFSANAASSMDIPNEATVIDVDVYRVEKATEATVQLTSTVVDEQGNDASNVFAVPSSVTFAAGETLAKLPVAVNFANVEADVTYNISITLNTESLSPYGNKTYSVSLIYSPWTEWKAVEPGSEFTWSVGAFANVFDDMDVQVTQSSVDPNKYEYGIFNFYYKGLNFTYSLDMSKTVEVDGVACPLVRMSVFELDRQASVNDGAYVGNMMFTDVATWAEMNGVAPERVDAFLANNGLSDSYYNPQTGTFYINDVYFIKELPALSYLGMGTDILQLPGYASYYIDFNYNGNFIDPDGEEYAVVTASRSSDVASYAYDIFAGALDQAGLDTAIEDIKSNTEAEKVTEALTQLTFQLEEGDYTIVAVGYDANGTEVCTADYTFSYESKQGAPKWQSLGYCEYTDGIINSVYYALGINAFDVEIQESTSIPGYYRLVDPYADLAAMYKNVFSYLSGKHYMEVDASDPTRVELVESYLGICDVDGEFGTMGKAFFEQYYNGVSADALAAAGYYGKFEDGVITFPAGMLYAIQGNSLYPANVDPNNPAYDDNFEGKPDWTLGTGTFCIDMSGLAAAPAKNLAPVKKGEYIRKHEFKSEFTLAKTRKQAITKEDIQNYFLANPRSFSK